MDISSNNFIVHFENLLASNLSELFFKSNIIGSYEYNLKLQLLIIISYTSCFKSILIPVCLKALIKYLTPTIFQELRNF